MRPVDSEEGDRDTVCWYMGVGKDSDVIRGLSTSFQDFLKGGSVLKCRPSGIRQFVHRSREERAITNTLLCRVKIDSRVSSIKYEGTHQRTYETFRRVRLKCDEP